MSDHSITPDTAAVDLTTRRPSPRSTCETTAETGLLRRALTIYILSALGMLAPIALVFDYMITYNLGIIAPCIGVAGLWLAGMFGLRRVWPLRTALAAGLGAWAGLAMLFTFAYTAFGFLEPRCYGEWDCSTFDVAHDWTDRPSLGQGMVVEDTSNQKWQLSPHSTRSSGQHDAQ